MGGFVREKDDWIRFAFYPRIRLFSRIVVAQGCGQAAKGRAVENYERRVNLLLSGSWVYAGNVASRVPIIGTKSAKLI
jgi:hypothetical protein